jgi:hypothetical protein
MMPLIKIVLEIAGYLGLGGLTLRVWLAHVPVISCYDSVRVAFWAFRRAPNRYDYVSLNVAIVTSLLIWPVHWAAFVFVETGTRVKRLLSKGVNALFLPQKVIDLKRQINDN